MSFISSIAASSKLFLFIDVLFPHTSFLLLLLLFLRFLTLLCYYFFYCLFTIYHLGTLLVLCVMICLLPLIHTHIHTHTHTHTSSSPTFHLNSGAFKAIFFFLSSRLECKKTTTIQQQKGRFAVFFFSSLPLSFKFCLLQSIDYQVLLLVCWCVWFTIHTHNKKRVSFFFPLLLYPHSCTECCRLES